MFKRIISALLFITMYLQPAFSQEQTMLYRGRLPDVILVSYNGTYFWEGKEFKTGDIYFNGRVYTDVLMNIDAHNQDVQVRMDAASSPIVIYRDEVAWLSYSGKTFVNLNYIGCESAPEGFFEILKDGDEAVLRQVQKVLRKSTANRNGSPLGYFDPEYNEDVFLYFEYTETYYRLENGIVKKISRRKARKEIQKPTVGENLISSVVWHPVKESSGRLFAVALPSSAGTLPDGYFEPQIEADDNFGEGGAQSATYRNKIYVIGSDATPGNRARVSGVVTDMESGEILSGVLVFEEDAQQYEYSDSRGRYTIELSKGLNTVHFAFEGKEEMVYKLEVKGDGVFDVALPDKINMLEGALISSESMIQHRTTGMGSERISINIVNKIPTAFGEGDIIKAVHMLPGVQSSGEAAGGINVRGGSTGENLILFNGNTIYNPNHLFGIFSSFNPDVVEGVELYKGTVPAEYGGRISSVMDVHSIPGRMDDFKASVGLGLVTSRLFFEGPLWKDHTSIVGGLRTTYSDWILQKLPKNSYYSGSSAGFTDANLGITHRFGNDGVLQFSSYLANDRFEIKNQVMTRYRNRNFSLQYRHRDDAGNNFTVQGGYDFYSSTYGDYSWDANAYEITTDIHQGFLKGVWKRNLGDHGLSAGSNTIFYALSPGRIVPYKQSIIVRDTLAVERGLEQALFVSDNYRINDVLSVEGGARISAFYSVNSNKPFFGPEVRFSTKFTPVETFSVKGGFDIMRQYIHLISNTSGISPTDTWRLSGDDFKPMWGWQGAFGLYWSLPSLGLDFSAESYWKETRNALDYKTGARLAMNPNLADDLVNVNGKAYGVEFMLKKPAGDITGWMSYTYSRAFYQETDPEGIIAGGKWYRAPFDKPHEFKAVLNWAMTHRYSLSSNIEYSTGRPATIPIGKYYYGGAWRIAYGERNAARIPDYFRVDIAFNVDASHYLRAALHSTFTIGVYNVLGRKNPYSVYYVAGRDGEIKGYMMSVFATQVPYINLNILF